MTNARVQISVSLLEKLAGIKKEQPKKQHPQQPVPHGLPLAFGLPVLQRPSAQQHEADNNLQQSIQQSRRVGELLLKAEEQELAAVQKRADELVTQYKVELRSVPCIAEQQACIACYQEHPKDALQCAQLVDAYTSCAQRAAGRLMT